MNSWKNILQYYEVASAKLDFFLCLFLQILHKFKNRNSFVHVETFASKINHKHQR